jgi:hypothetical protein
MEFDSRKARERWSPCKRVLKTLHIKTFKASDKQAPHHEKPIKLIWKSLKPRFSIFQLAET